MLVFGPAGTPLSASVPSTIAGVKRVAELGLGCMEIEFVQGVRMGEKTAIAVREAAQRRGVRLTAHAPYFINLYSQEEEKVRASQERILQTARIASLCGAESIVFHPAFYLGDPPARVYDTVKKHLDEVMARLRKEDNQVWIRPEVTGKTSQFGTIEEVLKLSSEIEGVAPCIDFAHWHARTRESNSHDEFASLLTQIEGVLGRKALDNMHIHVSGISYGKQGERKHLNLKESDFRYAELLKALKAHDVQGFLICESPNLEEDALLLQETYNTL